MSKKIILFIVIIIFTVLTVILNLFSGNDTQVFTWGLRLVPIFLVIILYPFWKIVLFTLIFFELMKFGIEFYMFNGNVPLAHILSLMYDSSLDLGASILFAHYRINNYKMLNRIESLTLVDPLTSINNRRYFHLYMEKAIPFSKSHDTPLLMLLFDIDHFKRINDTYGHVIGDQVLIEVTQIVKQHIRESDAFVRMGGEEFAIVMTEFHLEKGRELAERIRRKVYENPIKHQEYSIPVTISIGVGVFEDETIEEFIHKVDQALYEAKKSGRNQVV